MKLIIKEGSSIQPYGGGTTAFTSESDLSQDILSHLQKDFPDDIEDLDKETGEVETFLSLIEDEGEITQVEEVVAEAEIEITEASAEKTKGKK